ncbi:MAG: hypothetical protein WKF87_11965 [Chryseolinea sp.]
MIEDRSISVMARAATSSVQVLQSPYLKLYAAGSTGVESSKGVHLRWLLNGYLGEHHFPKGDYAGNNSFFNKRDDYVTLFRIPYNEAIRKAETVFNFYKEKPAIIHDDLRLWVFNSNAEFIHLHFPDSEKYSNVRSAIDPALNSSEFLNLYGDSVYELTITQQLFFALNVSLLEDSVFEVETFSVENKSMSLDEYKISSRKTFDNELLVQAGDQKIISGRTVAENMKKLRFRLKAGTLISIGIETYSHFFDFAKKLNLLQDIGKFALTTETDVAFRQLEDTARFKIHGSWAKFNEGGFVNVNNYHDRWNTQHGIKECVSQYITLSDTDPDAVAVFGDESESPDGTFMDISLQTFLSISSLDYHIARMLGLGYIDTKPGESESFIYLAAYATLKDPEDYGLSKSLLHLYMSLPTFIKDERVPQMLRLKPVTYGLTVTNGTSTPLAITDNHGYVIYGRSRFVKVKAELEIDFSISNSFFQPPLQFQTSDFSSPVFLGIEHKRNAETAWSKPELSHHASYLDTDGISETQTIYLGDTPYTHEVVEEGIDYFSVYPVNIFSRSSPWSNAVQTDKTVFARSNTLKAPFNVVVQLIQAENPLLLTSGQEQNWLSNIDASKTEILCRLNFDYYHVHDLNYSYGDTIEIYHKKMMPRSESGSIASIDNNDVNIPTCLISTATYTYISTGEVLAPRIEAAAKSKFIGSSLVYRNVSYRIEDVLVIQPDGSNPSFMIRKQETREAILIGGVYQLQQVFKAPAIDSNEPFLVVENLSVATNWEEETSNVLSFKIFLGHTNWVENIETYTDDAGNTKEEKTKGIWESADIAPVAATPGLYEITFNSYVLGNHPQFVSPDNTANTPSVDWCRGFVRIHTNGDPAGGHVRKQLRVDAILNRSPLKLIATDTAFSTDPTRNVTTGNSVSVNYHPGYQVYLRKETVVRFDKDHILPLPGAGTHSTIVGLRTLDSTEIDPTGEAFASFMSVPAVLLARALRLPMRPWRPTGPLFATPPDTFNKASYSFNVKFDSDPWAVAFFRIDINKILSSLYQHNTAEQIKADIPAVNNDQAATLRWQNLLDLDYASEGGHFKSFAGSNGDGYRLPNPDRQDIFSTPFNKPGDVVHLMKAAIYANLLPITEQPLIFNYIKGGSYVPTPVKQSIVDRNGKLLPPSHPDFQQAPMAKRISDKEILFTDFTLESDTDTSVAYFYVVRELGNSMKFGTPSAFLGPVQMVNTRPPIRPVILGFTSKSTGAYNAFDTYVSFELAPILPSQGISKILILRTEDVLSSNSPQLMDIVSQTDVSTLPSRQEKFTVTDKFTTTPDVPFGKNLYYRIVGVREVIIYDESGPIKTMSVYSEPSKTILTNVVDMLNPAAPEIVPFNLERSGATISRIDLRWSRTCYNGNYTLKFLTSRNAWENIASLGSNEPTIEFSFIRHLEGYINGVPIKYKFKVDVENTSGLVNKYSNITAVDIELL